MWNKILINVLWNCSNRTRVTLFEIIRRIHPGSIIVTDCWPAYFGLENLEYDDMSGNHSYHFVDSETLANIQEIEGMWFQAKKRNKSECGTKRSELNSYVLEFIWRKNLVQLTHF